jgi:hypothetical protein
MTKQEKKIKITEVPNDALRLFTKVEPVTISPTEIFDKVGVAEGDRWSLTVVPADCAVRDELREIEASINTAYISIDEEYGLGYEERTLGFETALKIAEVYKTGEATADALKEAGITGDGVAIMGKLESVEKHKKLVKKLAVSDVETRAILAKCVTESSNYKELKGEELVSSDKTPAQVVETFQDLFSLWLYDKVIELSSLRESEVLGV